MKLGIDYKFRDDFTLNKTDTASIELIDGPYKGVVFRFTTVSVKVDTDKDNALLNFDYDILVPEKEDAKKTFLKDRIFQTHIGLILNALILEINEIDTLRENNANRKSNSKQPIESWRLY